MLTPSSSPQIVGSHTSSPKRKDRENSIDPETNGKKPRIDAPDCGNGAETTLDGETGRDKEEKSDGPVNTADVDEGALGARDETPDGTSWLSDSPRREPWLPSRSPEDLQFDGCLVHPGRWLLKCSREDRNYSS